MAALRTDSPLTRRIVLSFLHFLNSVEVVPGVDREGLEVASQCLADVFGLDVSRADEQLQPQLLPSLFVAAGLNPTGSDSATAAGKLNSQTVSEVLSGSSLATAPSENSGYGATKDAEGRSDGEASPMDSLEERLFEQYREGLESAGHFDGVSEGTPDYQERISKARSVFQETIKKMSPSASSASEHRILAEAFKVQGNNAMAGQRYTEAIDLYTMAISLWGDNAVYYSNRAAAHTQVGKYESAIVDCNKAIQLDPNYSKAYSRLGLAYYGQGKYQESLEKGFRKAHSLDPNSKSIQENLQAAQQKLTEEQVRNGHQNSEQSQQHQTHQHSQSAGSGFNTSMPFNVSLPPGMANLFPAVANLAAQFNPGEQNRQAEPREGGVHGPNVDGQPPEVRLDGSINVTVEGDQLPPQLAGLMQSMLQMFAGVQGQPEAQQGASQESNRSQGNQNNSS